MIHCPGFAFSTAMRDLWTISSQLFVFIRSRLILFSPTPVKWPWPSMNPGIAVLPARSMTCVAGPT